MISDVTYGQIEDLRFSNRPLLICDVDEVVVHFTKDFEALLSEHGLWLDPRSFALSGNIRRHADGGQAHDDLIRDLVDLYFAERTLHQEPIDGAIEALVEIGRATDVVMLTNLPHSAGGHRRTNLARHGLPYPVVTNAGPKGPAIAEIVRRAKAPTAFVDDSPSFIASAYEHAPEVHLVHFLHDERFARHAEPMSFVSLRTARWDEAKPHILSVVAQGDQLP